jgi:hypothetical protein
MRNRITFDTSLKTKNMKKLITNLFFSIALVASFQVSAQYCGSSNLTLGTGGCGIATNYGFGNVDSFPCIIRSQCDSIIIPFKVYTNFTVTGVGTVPVYKLQFASIDSLPCGLCWSTSVSSNPANQANEFNANEDGCLKISGFTADMAGSYQLTMLLNVATSTNNDTAYTTHDIDSRAGGVSLWVKVINAGDPCPNTIDSTNPAHASTSCTQMSCPLTGINEVSKTLTNLSIQPNPMTNEAKVTFASEIAGDQQIRITDAIGRVVYTTTMTAKAGQNETIIKRNNMPAGIYILYVGNEQGIATKKFIIED